MRRRGISIITVVLALLSGCAHNRPDAEVVEGLRGLYPGGAEFGGYEHRIISRGEEIVPELIAASKDPSSQMRESAARCLGSIGSDAAVLRLIDMADDNQIKETIWIALSYSKSPKAIPRLELELASQTDQRARGRLLITLAECGDLTHLDQLLDVMKTTKLKGHIYHANQAFERIAHRGFANDTVKIESWLREQRP